MYQSTHAPHTDAETGPRDRTRGALVPAVAVAALLAVALVAAAYPVVAGLATVGLGGSAVALANQR